MSDDKNNSTGITIASETDLRASFSSLSSISQESQHSLRVPAPEPTLSSTTPRIRNYGSIVASSQSATRPRPRLLSDHACSTSTIHSANKPQQQEEEKEDKESDHHNERTSDEKTPLAPSAAGSSGSSTPENMRSTLTFLQKFGFGLGHVYNDLCAGVWFSYTLLFMQSVLGLPAVESGSLVMLGQVCDAIATPIVGVLADRYGTKRRWHVAGTVLVLISFPMIFTMCAWCSSSGYSWWPIVYFSIFIVILQVAWAIVQISHFAMIPELSRTTKDRADLTATRYSASVISNLVVYVTMWLVLQGRNAASGNIGPDDKRRFRDIALILTLIGLSMSVLFHFSLALSDYEHRRQISLAATREFVRENESPRRKRRSIVDRQQHDDNDDDDGSDDDNDNDMRKGLVTPTKKQQHENGHVYSETRATTVPHERRRHMRNFLRSPLLYQNALLYVFARLFMTTSLLYMPLWLDERTYQVTELNDNSPTSLSVESLATVPLVSFLSSFVSSMLLKQTNRWLPHKMAYLVGSSISVSACMWIAFATPKAAEMIQLFMIAVLFGSGSSITMVSSLCITADMIGQHTYQGGFIYSTVTFADKLITGIVVASIEAIKCKRRADCPTYYQSVLAYGCGLAATLGVITLWTLRSTARCTNRHRSRHEVI